MSGKEIEDKPDEVVVETPVEPEAESTVATQKSTDPKEPAKETADEKKPRLRTPTLPSIGPRGRIALRAAAVVALAASIGSSVFFFQRSQHDSDLLAAQEDARAAACKYAPVLVTYDAKNLDAYFNAVLAGATGEWKTQFDNTSKDLRDVLTQGQVVAKANEVQCAIRTGDQNSAEAIVVIGQTITSLGTQGKPAPGQLSMVMRLEHSGDHWLVNKLNSPLVQPPQS
ncbi:hypothetical protein ACFVUS_26345 [Nocardia sp. NPDC058058]|uniref:hypothetical protein n=1 Tax=Nocardia sp. NPDC058058 TaxID=3346317 RepID=UPI0036D82F20